MILTFIELIITKMCRVMCCNIVGISSSTVQVFHEQAVGTGVLCSHQTCCNSYTNNIRGQLLGVQRTIVNSCTSSAGVAELS